MYFRFSLEEKQSAMRDLMKREKVLRSESRMVEMVDLIGPKGRVCQYSLALLLSEWTKLEIWPFLVQKD